MKSARLTAKSILALSAVALSSLSALAGTTAWTGTVDSNWSTAGNWTNGVPQVGGGQVYFTGTTHTTINDDGPSNGNYGTTYFQPGAGPFTLNQGATALYGLNGNLYNYSKVGTQTLNVPVQVIYGNPGGYRSFSLTNGSSLVINGVVSQGPAGSVNGLFLTGSGTKPYGALTLSASNTFSGPVTNNGVTLNINNPQALGTGGPFVLTNSATIDNTSGSNITTLSYNQFWNDNFTFVGTTNLSLGAGAVTLATNVTVTSLANTLTVGGTISGAYKLTKAGAGTLQLGGPNAYSGDTTVSAGTLQLGAANVMPSGAGKGNVSLTGTLDLNSFSQALNGLSGNGTIDTLADGTPTLTVWNNNQSSTFTGVIKNSAGTLALTKTGTGTLTLSGSQTYSGATTVGGGTLAVSTGGSCANSAVSVGTSSTLGLAVASAGGQWTCAGLTYADATAAQQFSFGFLTPSTTTAPLQVNGDLTFTATPVFKILSGAFVAGGAYPLVHYTGVLSGNAPTTVTMPPHSSGSLSNDVDGHTLWLVVTGMTQPLAWAAGSGVWDINATANWQDATGASTTYQEPLPPGDAVLFEDTVSGAGPIAVTLNSTVSPASLVASNSAKAYTIAGTGAIAGSGGLTKNGNNTLTLSTTNSYTGATTLNGGTLNVSNLLANGLNSALGAGTSLVFNGGTLKYTGGATNTFNRNITINSGGGTLDERSAGGYLFLDGVISGTGGGSFTNNSVQLIITNNNTYDGVTYIIGGQTQIRHVNALGSTAGRTVVASGAQLAAGGGLVGTIYENIDLNGVGTSGALAAFDANTAVTFAGTITLVTDSGIGGSDNFTISGPIAGSGSLVKLGSITNTLTGTNTYTGNTRINAGTLALSLPAGITSSLSNSPAIIVAAGALFDVSRVTSGFVLGGGQSLQGGGAVTGAVTVADSASASASVHPGGGGTNATTLAFRSDLTFAGANAQAVFDLSSTSNGANDKVTLNNTTLICSGAQIAINCGAALDTTHDYVLFDVGSSGSITGNFNPAPAWVGTTPAGASQYSVVVSGQQVLLHFTPIIPVTIASGLTANNKAYDGTTTATLSANNVVLAGVAEADAANVALSLSGATANFASAQPGTGLAVTVSGLTLTGSAAANYTLVQPVLSADITPAPLKVTGLAAANKVYDGTTNATLLLGSAGLSGVLNNESVVLNATNATGAFADASAGTNKVVTVSGLGLAGADAGNYRLVQPALSADILMASTTNVLTSSTNVAQVGETVTFSAVITPVAPGAGMPTGTIQFLTNGVAVDGPVALTNGAANCSVSLPGGTNLLEAQYSGDANFLGCTNTLSQIVNLATVPPPSIVSQPSILSNGNFHVGFGGLPGYRYTIEWAPSVEGPWTTLTNLAAGTDGLIEVEDATQPQPAARFYRPVYP